MRAKIFDFRFGNHPGGDGFGPIVELFQNTISAERVFIGALGLSPLGMGGGGEFVISHGMTKSGFSGLGRSPLRHTIGALTNSRWDQSRSVNNTNNLTSVLFF